MSKVKNVGNAIDRNITKKLKQFKNSNVELQKIAKRTQSDLRASLREGIKPNGDILNAIGEKWDERREDLAEVNKTSKFLSLTNLNSNATFTGELVRKIFAVVKGNKIVIKGKGSHKRYKGARGKPIGKATKISDILTSFADRGDQLLGITDKTKKRIKKQFIAFLRRNRK